MKSEKLRASAQNNTERDFEFAYFDNIDDALVEGLEQNQDFFSLLWIMMRLSVRSWEFSPVMYILSLRVRKRDLS